MGMLPETMWWMRPVDFWRMYRWHIKKIAIEAQKTTMLLTFGKLDDVDKINDLYQSMFYMLLGQPKPEVKHKGMIETYGEEYVTDLIKRAAQLTGIELPEDYKPVLG